MVPMGLCASGDIFQDKLDDILGDINGVNMYNNDILVLGKVSFYQHIEQLRVIFASLRSAGLKINAPNCRFGSNHIPLQILYHYTGRY